MGVQTACVTLEGDKVSPGGDMSGGASSRGGSMLQQLTSIHQQELMLGQKLEQLEQIGRELRQISGVAEQFNTLSQQLELKQTELGMIRGRLQQTVHHQLEVEVKELQDANQAVEGFGVQGKKCQGVERKRT